jgi:actin related protein 2/3 complex subunit 2
MSRRTIKSNAMILLRPGHRCLSENIEELLTWAPNPLSDKPVEEQKRRSKRIFLSDFNNVSYKVEVKKQTSDIMTFSANLPFLDDIRDHGAQACLDREYGDLVVAEGEAGYNLTMNLSFADYPDEKSQKAILEKLECVHKNVLGSVFEHYFEAVNDGKVLEPFMFDLRADTQVYFSPKADGQSCSVIFGIDFGNKFDQVLAKVFLQEFQDSRRTVASAPPVNFSINPQAELRSFGIEEATGNLGFINFTVLSRHVNSEKKRAVVADILQGFRTYLQYHIKCAKSYFHSCMRARCVALVKVLNRARGSNSVVYSTKEKVTIVGKNKGI